MSVLSYPRIHFKGKCLVNPATGNNDDVSVNIDTVNAALLPPLAALTDADARAWMMSGVQAVSPVNKQIFWYLRGAWNYYGDMSVTFSNTAVTAAVGNDGKVSTSDPIVGQAINLLGSTASYTAESAVSDSVASAPAVICDLDPLGTALTQIFVGGLTLGDDRLGFRAAQDSRAFARWVLWRNASTYQGEQNFTGAGATWQFGISRAALVFNSPSTSPVLGELQNQLASKQGIVVQFCFYLIEPHIGAMQLIAQFQKKQFVRNPAEAFIVGTIGIWEHGELLTAPGDRLLLASPTAKSEAPSVLGSAIDALGPCTARIQQGRDVVSLNLITTFPEANYQRPPLKADLGRVVLGVVRRGNAAPIPIGGPLAYDCTNYELTGGVVDVPYDPGSVSEKELADGTLVLLAEKNPKGPLYSILTEANSSITIETDDRGVYCDVGDSGTISILIRERGAPPAVT